MVNSVAKAFKLIECILKNGNRGTLVELSREIKQKVPTVHNLLKTLIELGQVCRTGDEYHVTAMLADMSYPYFYSDKLTMVLDPVMKVFNADINESVVLVVERNFERITVKEYSCDQSVIANSNTANFPRLYNLATVWVLIAYFPENRLCEFIKKNGLPGPQWNAITSIDTLQAQLHEIRKRLWATSGFTDCKVSSFASPVFRSDGQIVAALGTYIPMERLNKQREREIITKLVEAAREMSFRLGFKNQDTIT
ncbi:MAG: hypothetical protein A2487_15180 [Candidatus Raymondbacteria bacterium RifOxyC12_full_50_8]|uniref:IclR-ED domain-containing protein n=1 Tax=Candidatus Raymondbacteria bacterium RIFOXYD12_FULL_49_13 TaxID=1817890 RepID=A0A1F7FJJ8_UNCRA|nr:MAG: hypothetical protein A2350_10570 [Candidatus Raymondbacteria bacterium RifOxyB12_full_50_8]OGJ91980.1 MAG: hypothetical protein A2248_09400 [Candidatus Raymondbacteria bacterium RIFOXYA2_FULL_49_16]OGJ96352.1 MAG: hypothetical protein A2453_08490 [Candidatus Raymondbacteria bacterium RIFOXYC2_FULL_50_21]OGK03713.1 MAG: hypothetical protein A2487_15180 [Candidatus Raymondbacteria bacterium RifOxyC12_full_50_8]OGK06889.1 MAG: hypothetical protein A2519_11560 [Candidatus Raymondbacteria ba